MKNRLIIILSLSLSIIFISSCSVEKNTALTRTYHNVTLKYNIYFNGNEAYKRGIKRIEDSNIDNYNETLSLFVDSKEENVSSATADMEKAIQKSAKGIKLHSITKKPTSKSSSNRSKKDKNFFEQKEYNRWVDDCYLLMGKAYFVKREYFLARQNFEFIARQFPNLETKHNANLYLARTFIESKNYKEAKETLDYIEGQKDLPKKLEGQFNAIYADFFLKQKRYEEAIPKLKKSIELTKRKKDKRRYTYVLAQLYEQKGDNKKASETYKIVARKNNSYEMEFNSKINMAKCYVGQGKNNKDIRKLLLKMLRNDKNIEYQDQIYFALAEIDKRAKKTDDALSNYVLSSKNSVSNDYQKAISCLNAGEIFFEKEDYKNSQLYYDSCMMFIPTSYNNYSKLRKQSIDLNELVKFTNVVEFEDSVQILAKMPEKERLAIIDKKIAEIIEQERIEKELEQQSYINSMIFDQRRGSTGSQMQRTNTGGWYFYNPSQLSFGKNEFSKKWGNRKNEDHWRRRNKAIADLDEFGNPITEQDSATTETNRLSNNKDRAFYLQDIPLTDSSLLASNDRIKTALYNLGEIYKDRFSNYEKSISSYEELNKRYPDNDVILLSYYNLYMLNKLIKNEPQAEKYKNLIISKYPNTNYAKLLQNPNFVKELEEKRKADEELYMKVYDKYMDGHYNEVNTAASSFIANNPDNALIPNFDFLKTLSIGKTTDTTSFKISLVEFINNYPESQLVNAAENILLYFGSTNVQELIADLKNRPQATENFRTQEDSSDDQTKEENKIEDFIYDEQAEHYYLIFVKTGNIDTKRLSFEVRNFNIFNFSMKTFNVINTVYDINHEIIIVKSFKNKRQSINYSNLIANSEDVFSKLKNVEHKVFVISEENYEKMKNEKSINKYLTFYNQNYK